MYYEPRGYRDARLDKHRHKIERLRPEVTVPGDQITKNETWKIPGDYHEAEWDMFGVEKHTVSLFPQGDPLTDGQTHARLGIAMINAFGQKTKWKSTDSKS